MNHNTLLYILAESLAFAAGSIPACAADSLPAAAVSRPAAALSSLAAPERLTVAAVMQRLQAMHGVHFVYDSSLRLDMTYTGPDITSQPLSRALEQLFRPFGIDYTVRRSNVILRPGKTAASSAATAADRQRTFTLGGRITDTDGEPIVNATVFDLDTKDGTVSNARGRYLMHLSEGRHRLRISSVGCLSDTLRLNVSRSMERDIQLAQTVELHEVVVTEDLNSPLLTTQTGKRTFTPADINNGYALLSSPDLVKTMQRTSGVNSGIDLASGLYVHGGASDENLFLLDGAPLYQAGHSFGLFSSFNTDIIKNADFYKSGFPARYSGRVSSVTDVRTRDGSMERVHGSYSVGTLDGRIQVEGPVVKDRTSFNVSLRRSWADLILRPACAIINSRNKEDKNTLGYMFHDFNAKLTHRLADGSTLWASMYSGRDSYIIDHTDLWEDNTSNTKNRFAWGNTTFTLGGDFRLSPVLSLQTMLTATYSHSRQEYYEDDYDKIDPQTTRYNYIDTRFNRTQMIDIAAHADFSYAPSHSHRIRFGAAVTRHQFRPQTKQWSFYFGDPATGCDTTDIHSRVNIVSLEATAYAEDEMRLAERLSANAGTSLTLTNVRGRTYAMLDPRLALKWQMGRRVSMKLSYTHMSQTIHRMSSSFLELPTDFWVPTTDEIRPTVSHQLAAGLYAQPSPRFSLSVEAYYKRTSHLLQFRNWMGLRPPATTWNSDVTDGSGKSYGVEADAAYTHGGTSLRLAYTLSWSKRLFREIYPEWFDDQFDNRHKIDISLHRDISRRVSVYAAWTFHSGNRTTMPVGYAISPTLPGNRHYEANYIYDRPNNFRLPSYHRLDIGANFRHTTRHGREAVWNVSVYNAYCHLNTMYVDVKLNDDSVGTPFRAKCNGFIPIIPSVSYTLKF